MMTMLIDAVQLHPSRQVCSSRRFSTRPFQPARPPKVTVKRIRPHRGRGGDGSGQRGTSYLVARPPPAPLRLQPAGDRVHAALGQHEGRAQVGHGDRKILSAIMIAHRLSIPRLHYDLRPGPVWVRLEIFRKCSL